MTGATSAGTLDEGEAPLAAQASCAADRLALDDVQAVRLLPLGADGTSLDDRVRVRFLAQPSWNAGTSAVASVLSPYVRAFWPDEPVSLLLVLPPDDSCSLADAERITRDAIDACGRSADEVPEIVITRARPRAALLEHVDVVTATNRTLIEVASEHGVRVVPLSRGALRAAFGDAVARREFERMVPMLRSVCEQATIDHPSRSQVSALLETFLSGYRHFLATGEVREEAVGALSALGWLTDGQIGEALIGLYARAHPPYDITVGSALLTEHEVPRVAAGVADTGVAIIPGRFPAAARAQLAAWVERSADLSEPALLANRVVRAFAMDLAALAVAQGVLGCVPVLERIDVRGRAEPGAGRRPAARRIYAPASAVMDGVHVLVFLEASDGNVRLVRGSHRSRPLALRRAGGFTEEDVASAYGHDTIIPVVGPPGTIAIADARCLRSEPLPGEAGPLTLVMRLSSSLFGAPAHPVPVEHAAPGGFAHMVERCPRTYARYTPGAASRPPS